MNNLSSTTSHFSFSDNDDDSSISEIQVSRLQDEILQQSRCIEEFIRNSKQNEDSSALKVLRSLFSLFKSELSLNLTIRKVLVSERKKAGLSYSSIRSLFRSLHNSGFSSINNFDEIVSQMTQQSLENQSLLQQNKLLKKSLKSEKRKNQTFTNQIIDLEKEIAIKKKNQKDNIFTIKDLTEKVDKSNIDIQNLNQEIIKKRDKILELEQINHDLQLKIQEIEKEKKIIQEKYDKETAASKMKIDESKMIFYNQVTNYQKEIAKLKNDLNEQQQNHEQEIADLHAQYLTDIEMIKKESNDKVNYLSQDKKIFEESAKKELESQKICLDSLRYSFVEKESVISQQNEELVSLKKSIIDYENSNIELNKMNSNLKQKLKKLAKQNKNLLAQINDVNQNYSEQISSLKASLDADRKKIESSALKKWQTKVQTVESSLRDVESICDEQKVENKKLKEIIHKLSFNLQQEEAENAKLHSALQVKKLRNADQLNNRSANFVSMKTSIRNEKKRIVNDDDISSMPLSVSLSSSISDE